MVDSRDRSALRTLAGNVVGGLGNLTHKELNPAFEQLGMPPVPDDGTSKRDRIELSLSLRRARHPAPGHHNCRQRQ